MLYQHTPVLLNEVLKYLNPQPDQNYIDATLGGGGYSQAIFSRIQPQGKLLSIDLDIEAIENQKSKIKNQNWILHHGNFRDIDKIAAHHQFSNIQGIVADIGFSSFQLDQSGRGISFQKKEQLDMRFDQSQKENAEFILNTNTEKELKKIFKDFGEEKFSRQIARKITEHRTQNTEIKYTTDLYQIIQNALPKPVKHRAGDSARRIFQALRIAVNHELDNLDEFLPKAFNILTSSGRLAVVSFHSLEDRMVKEYFLGLAKGCVCPPDFPQCICGRTPKAKILTKKPITASDQELKENIRAKPAKLRVIQKN
jgi:16S rRNA (cytosine1402-N4)-methyltransferase